ncbi:metallophosphoesterase [Schumannella sp. 10F1B-5-1]|uniref:metallophosphoesterase n=1 Tax=Schumannella sp. 10F1B-5-1 TaxID=2590780 RepID=UPI00112FE0EB|nr:metallophosphoesterase [Schumannella sp. 10F1B-5-1]TPW72358.1 phosphodiesterase [Schumannella sp. 10F1B-5-1]
MVQLGQHPEPLHTIAHISDTHFLDGARPLYGALSSEATLQRALEQLEISGLDIEAIVFTGDLADLGETDAYQRLRAIVDPAAERLGARPIWVMGNHDEREPFAEHMLGAAPSSAPQDAVYDVNGLRIVALDSTVPGYHHGELTAEQLDWLRGVLAEPAPHGTLLALHHPPIPSPVEIMAILELQDQPALEAVVRGSDVIGIVGGHLHYSTHSTFAGVPVAVAAATCYTMDVLAPVGTLAGVDGGQSVHLTQVYPDRVVHSIVPVGSPPRVSGFSGRVLERLAAMTPDARREAFSNKRSVWKLPPEA